MDPFYFEKYRIKCSYWRTAALQCCIGLHHVSTRISHKYTYVPSLLGPPPISLLKTLEVTFPGRGAAGVAGRPGPSVCKCRRPGVGLPGQWGQLSGLKEGETGRQMLTLRDLGARCTHQVQPGLSNCGQDRCSEKNVLCPF